MKRNRFSIIISIIVIAIALWLLNTNNSSTLSDKETGFAVTDTSLVTKIFIADKNADQVTLKRTDDGWILNSKYPTNNRVVESLLGTMQRIKVKAPVPLAGRDNVISRLASIGIKVEVYKTAYRIDLFDKVKLFPYEKADKVYYVGDVTPDNLGTYMLLEDAENPYITYIPGFRGFLTPRFSPKPDDWKSHQVFKHTLSDIKSVMVEFGEKPEESFRVDVEASDGSYTLTSLIDASEIANFDTLKLLNFLTSFSDLRYETRLNNIMSLVRLDSILQTPVIYEVTLVDNRNDTTYLRAFYKRALPQAIRDEEYFKLIPMDNDRFYAEINDGEDFVLLQYYIFDKVLHPLSYYTQ